MILFEQKLTKIDFNRLEFILMMNKNYQIYVGTYTNTKSKGIYTFKYSDGKIDHLKLLKEIDNPKYLCMVGEYIAAVCDFENDSGVLLIDSYGNTIDKLSYEKTTSCYIGYQNNYLYTANYHEGSVNIININNGKLSHHKTIKIKDQAGCHQVYLFKDYFLVPCLLLDKIIVFDANFNIHQEILLPKNSGPRHIVDVDDYLYVVGELDNILYIYNNKLKLINKINILNGVNNIGGSAALRYYDHHLYVSTRDQNVISVFKLNQEKISLVQIVSTDGKHPRDFMIIDNHLLALNRLSDNMTVFKLNNGLITQQINKINIPEGIAIIAKEEK